MQELIDRIEALGKLQTMYIQIECACGDWNPVAKGVRKAYKAIERMPTVEAEPVRHGRWIFVGEETMHDWWTHRKYKCSECEFQTVEAVNFCQKCGARMDGGADNG